MALKEKLDAYNRLLPFVLSADTSFAPEHWTAENPLAGHCVPVCLFIHEFLGGDILKCRPVLPDGSTEKHYYNLIDGQEFDLTGAQYPVGTRRGSGFPYPKNHASTQAFLLSNPDTVRRYTLFRQRMLDFMCEKGFSF